MINKKILKRISFPLIRVVCICALFVYVSGCMISQPSFRKNKLSSLTVDPARLRTHVEKLSKDFHPRNWMEIENLNNCADYIADQFEKAGAMVENQEFKVYGKTYRNVIGRFNAGKGSRIIIGAHYDTCEQTPGADDNASGIAGLIELAYLLGKHLPEKEIELVAYPLEEPPFYNTPNMGSAVHAKSVAEDKANIAGVVVLEMIGYFDDSKGSQSYPMRMLHLIYPDRGNFIAVIGPWNQGKWVKKIKTGMKGTSDLPVYSMRAPAAVPGVDFSDHKNYWPYGINAVMITDTSFYRNKHYHEDTDTADKLDYDRMAKVVIAVFEAIQKE